MQGIVIQGPTNYWDQIIHSYKGFPNVVWSTWDDEPIENINSIKKYINVIQTPKPENFGCLNVNLQSVSTYKGLEYLKNLGVTEVLKTRSDIKINHLKKFMSLLEGRQMSFLATCKEGVRKDCVYELGYIHTSHDYPTDQVIYGNIDHLQLAFNFLAPDELQAPPEAIIVYSYLIGLGEDFNLDFEYLKSKGITFFMEECVKNKIELFCVKEKFNCDFVQFHNSELTYNF